MPELNNQESHEPPTRHEYVDNGLLFFISNKMNFMSHDDIICICKDFYDEDDIHESKMLMYEKYDKAEQAKSHRGVNKSLNDLKEMVSFMSQQPLPNFKFCITKCTQVPPVVLDYVDAASLSRHISKLRGDIVVSSATLAHLIARMEMIESDVKDLKDVQSTTQKHQQPKQNAQREEMLSQGQPCHDTEQRRISSLIGDARKKSNKNSGHRKGSQPIILRGESTDGPSGLIGETTLISDSGSLVSSDSEQEWQMQRHQLKKIRRLRERTTRPSSQKAPKRNARPAVIGTRTGNGIPAVRPVRDVALFVSRLSPDVDPEELRAYVEELAGVKGTTLCESLQQRHPSYLSFKIKIGKMPKEKIAELYKPENWHQDILVKRWFD